MDRNLLVQIQHLLEDNRKIEAIKLLREATGLGLKEAKEAVEAMESGNFSQPENTTQATPVSLQEEIKNLLERGEFIAAIKAYREKTGADLKESKEAVERIAGELGISVKSGCLGVVLLGTFLSGWLIPWTTYF